MKRNYARFYLLFNRLPTSDKDELKAELVRQYTKGRTESLREMNHKEYDALCNALQNQINGDKSREIIREQLRQKRSAVLHQLQKMGIDTTDWDRINAYCKNPRIAGQEFAKLTVDELDMLLIKLRMIKRKDNNSNHSHLN